MLISLTIVDKTSQIVLVKTKPKKDLQLLVSLTDAGAQANLATGLYG